MSVGAFRIPVSPAGGGAGSYNIVEITASGTYTAPANLLAAWVVCVPGGAGGGSGRRGASTTLRTGGTGGAGGTLTRRFLLAADIGVSKVVTIGAGGTGGAAQTADNTDGNPGGAGADTSFGSLVVAKPGTAGLGGSNTTVFGSGSGQNTATTPIRAPFSFSGASSGSLSTQNGVNGTDGLTNVAVPSAGGGNGISTGNAVGTSQAIGGGVYDAGTLIAGPNNGGNGTDNRALTLFDSTTLQATKGIGTAGAGGRSTTGNNGGNGGLYGCPGGGGAGTLNGTNSGKGGDGAQGLILILEILS